MAVKRSGGQAKRSGHHIAAGKAIRPAKTGYFCRSSAMKGKAGNTGIKVSPRDARAALGRVVHGSASGTSLRAARLREGAEIVAQAKEWAGGIEEAAKWYRSQPIPALGERTAEALVMDGEAALVREYLDHLSQGGYA